MNAPRDTRPPAKAARNGEEGRVGFRRTANGEGGGSPCVPDAGRGADAKAEGEAKEDSPAMRGPRRTGERGRWPDPRYAGGGAQKARFRAAPASGKFWRPPRGRRGFSLLELLIATTLGAVLTVAVTQLFTSAGRFNAELVGHARLQESARHALGFLGRSIRAAGYLGCGGGAPNNGLRGDWRQLVEFDISTPVQGFNGLAGSAAWQPELSGLPLRRGAGAPTFRRGGIDPARLRPGSDILVVRRVATPLQPLLQPLAAESDPLVVADERSAMRRNRFVALTRCGGAGLFRLTSVSRRGGAATLARAVGGGTFANRSGGLLGGAAFGDAQGPQGAAVGLVLSEIYFVARAAGANNRGESAWSLWRKTSAERPAELVRGIDELQVLFGVDESPNDAVAAVERLSPPGAATGTVRSVQVTITASTVDAAGSGPPARRTFGATFAVRNA